MPKGRSTSGGTSSGASGATGIGMGFGGGGVAAGPNLVIQL